MIRAYTAAVALLSLSIAEGLDAQQSAAVTPVDAYPRTGRFRPLEFLYGRQSILGIWKKV